MRDGGDRWERAALYGGIGAAAGTVFGTTLLGPLGPAAIAGGAVFGAVAGLVVGLVWKRNGS